MGQHFSFQSPDLHVFSFADVFLTPETNPRKAQGLETIASTW
jgi:hypothetical protein